MKRNEIVPMAMPPYGAPKSFTSCTIGFRWFRISFAETAKSWAFCNFCLAPCSWISSNLPLASRADFQNLSSAAILSICRAAFSSSENVPLLLIKFRKSLCSLSDLLTIALK